MKKKIVLCITLIVMTLVFIYAQQYDPISDFNFTRSTDGLSVIITRYVGGKRVVNIPPEIRGLSVTSIGEVSFFRNNLTSITIPNSVIAIGDGAFLGNNLTNIVIPDNVISIGARAFQANNLNNITIANSVIFIGEWAFAGNNLTSITIPNSVTFIGEGAFAGNVNLTSINVSQNNTKYSSINGVLYNKNVTDLISYPARKAGVVIIPNSVISIGEWAFAGNNLTNFTIPNSITSIGNGAFYGNNLTSITIPNSVTFIGDEAFSENNLTSITISNSVTSIGERTFAGNGLTSITIPNNVTSIGEGAFAGNNLASITIGNNVILSNYCLPNEFLEFYNRVGRKAGTYDFQGSRWVEW